MSASATARRPGAAGMAELGITGLSVYGGQVFDELTRELQGQRWQRVVRAMTDNDPVVGGVLYAVEALVRQVTWVTEPASDASEHLDDAQLIEECLADLDQTWPDTLGEILSFLPWGFSLLEPVYKLRGGYVAGDAAASSRYDDGKIGWAKLAPRAQESVERWVFGPNGQIEGVEQAAPGTSTRVVIPAEKLLHFRTTSRKGGPEGRSVLRSAWKSWYYGSSVQRIEAIGIERDLAGLPVAYIPSDLLDPQRSGTEQALYDELKAIVTGIRRDEREGVLWPSERDDKGNLLYELKLLSTGGARQMNTDAVIQRYDTRVAMAMLADFILLGHEKVGSFALADSKTNLFAVALGAYLDAICAVFNRKAIPQLLRLNGRPTDQTPVLEHGDLDSVDLGALGTFVEKLTAAGFVFTAGQKQWVLERGGLPVDQAEAGETPDTAGAGSGAEQNQPPEPAQPPAAPD